MARSKLPEERPVTGDLHVQIEVDYETVLHWQEDGVQVALRVDPQTDYAAIPEDNDFPADSPTTIPVTDLPRKYQHQFADTVRVVANKYDLTGDDGTCTARPPSDNGILSFTTHLQD